MPSKKRKQEIDKIVDRIIKQYGEALDKLAKE